MTVLIAEDMDILRQDIRETLEKTGEITVVAEAASGKAALEEYLLHRPDIVLMDIEMESKTAGIEAAEKIQEKDPGARIIYLTSHDSDEIIVSALATGARDYVVKGCGDDVLISHIKSVMDGSCNLDSRVQAVLMGEYSRVKKQEKGLLYFVENLSRLTPVERELITLLIKGYRIREIADKRNVEIVTVKSQIRTLLQKVGLSRTKELVKIIEELGLSYLFT